MLLLLLLLLATLAARVCRCWCAPQAVCQQLVCADRHAPQLLRALRNGGGGYQVVSSAQLTYVVHEHAGTTV
jgi:hypothetical protein